MPTPADRFPIGETEGYRYWATHSPEAIALWRAPPGQSEAQLVVEFHRDLLRNLLIWADEGSAVTASLTGPLGRQVIDASQAAGMTPEMFIWTAVRMSLDVMGGE